MFDWIHLWRQMVLGFCLLEDFFLCSNQILLICTNIQILYNFYGSHNRMYLLILFQYYFIFVYSRFLLVIHFIHISVYMSIQISKFITAQPHPPDAFTPSCPYVCTLHLCLNFCHANRFICTIFLGSTYMR